MVARVVLVPTNAPVSRPCPPDDSSGTIAMNRWASPVPGAQ